MHQKLTYTTLALCLVTLLASPSQAMNPRKTPSSSSTTNVEHVPHFTITSSTYFYDERRVEITCYPDNHNLIVKDGDEVLTLNAEEKPHFKTDTGEDVVEYTGLATDQNADRSWARAEFAPGGYSPGHLHKERTEDYYVIEGQAKVIIDGVVHELSVADHIKIKPNQVHQVVNASEKDKLVIIVKCAAAWVPDDYHVVSEVGSLKNIKW